MKTRLARHPRLLRVAGGALVSLVLFLEGGCGSGRPISSSSSSSVVAAYERVRVNAWDPSRRFKALFKAEVSRNVGAISRGYLSVWWDGAGGTLTWRSSAPIVGTGRGGFLRRGGRGGTDSTLPVPGHFAPDDLIACIIGTPDAPASPSLPFEETPRGVRLRIDAAKRTALLNREGMGIELTFPNGETVKLEPGEGVPRRIEANGPEGRAVLTLESYSSWPEGEPVPPA